MKKGIGTPQIYLLGVLTVLSLLFIMGTLAAHWITSGEDMYPDLSDLGKPNINISGEIRYTNISCSNDQHIGQNENGTLICKNDTNYGLDESTQDIIAAMITSGNHTLITVYYNDSNDTFDFTVNPSAGDTYNTTEEMQDAAWNIGGGTQTGITVTYQDATDDVDFVVDFSTAVLRADWTTINDYPSGCNSTSFIRAIGDTLTCDEPTDSDTTYSAGTGLILTSTTFSVNTTWINASILPAWNNSMKNYVDGQDVIFNNSLKAYVDLMDTTFNNSLKAYIDARDIAFNNTLKAYTDTQDAATNTSATTYATTYAQEVNTTMKNYADGTFQTLPEDDTPDNDGEVPDDITLNTTKNITAQEDIIMSQDKYLWFSTACIYYNGTALIIKGTC